MDTEKQSRRKVRETPRREFEVAYYTKELGRPLQRKMLERQLAGLGDGAAKANHHDEPSAWSGGNPPPGDRAG